MRLGYQDALGANPLKSFPGEEWQAVIERAARQSARKTWNHG